ncbi:alpha-methylacyl-CoA racemase [Zerene cesonia]|uniref:alpha-methylacyl-CoA racemase n=1 Tax=Zerene cesonia TaxID=33412 RepID=UPI0018E58DA6|nr:alpha-methylacyl-CoA racemase [Zerene cesonia]
MALRGIKVVEMIGLAPGPVCGSILADFGATVTVVAKIEPSPVDIMCNGKRMVSVNLKSKEGVGVVKKLCATSDVLIDTYRPGVLEKLGLGPEVLMKENTRLIYTRLSGYGQDGYYRDKPGHDINYVAISGVLSMLKKDDQPPRPPINLLADFAGGSMISALGIMMALFERTKSGKGQQIDASMVEGAAYVANWLFKSRNLPFLNQEPGKNILDGGAACYGVYRTKDGKFMAVGAIEPYFYSNFLKGLQLLEDDYNQYGDDEHNRRKFQEQFLTKTQDEWVAIFDELDACVTPVVEFHEAQKHKCNSSRSSFYIDHNSLVVPEPAPRLSRTFAEASGKKQQTKHGQHTMEVLLELGYSKTEINNLINKGIVYATKKSNL